MDTLFEVLINLYEGFLLIFFMYVRLPSYKKTHWWIDVFFVLLSGGVLCLYQYCDIGIPDTLIFLIPFLYSIVRQRGNWLQRIIWTLVLGIVFDTVVKLVSTLYTAMPGVSMRMLLTSGQLRVSYVLITNMALTAVLAGIAYARRGSSGLFLGRSSLVVFIVALLIEFAIAEMQFYLQAITEIESTAFFCINLGVFILMLITLLLYEMLTQAAKTKHLTEMRLQTLTLDLNHQKEMTAVYDEMLSVQHDLRKQVNTVRQLLDTSPDVDRETALSLLKADISMPHQYITGCTAVDAILTAKHALMERDQITFTFKPYPLRDLPIEQGDFCILLTNILDNAMEGVNRIDNPSMPRKICLEFSRTWDMFYLRCTNTMNPQTIHRVGERFQTSKSNQRFHGFGTESIRRIVEENGGVCTFNVKDNDFIVDIMLARIEKKDVADAD